ncbi:MAG: extracellular solute-binding protein [Gemmatales bacterium]|nr:extracellular solute-binding protein [Gemmatales bacterium]MDW8385866.1 extracellular solute-binding protein [Gemmatales bacterium]
MSWRRWVIGLLLAMAVGCGKPSPRVVLYCAQDLEYATEILADFERESGIKVDVRADTEANKSVSLYEAIVQEKRHPRCDVFWNNEPVNMVRLERQGLLQPTPTSAADPFPAWARGPNNAWYAFAARARILIVNNRLSAEEMPQGILELTAPKWKGRVAMAKPQYGTTATQAACLFQVLGKEKAQQFYTELRPNVTLLPGNKDVAIAVSEGRFDVGLTDTDDAIIEIRNGRPVRILYPDQQTIGTLFLPNTLAIIKGSPNPESARKLLDYLLSPAVEKRLAEGRSAQIPLNPNVQANLPIEPPSRLKAMEVDFAQAAELWEEVQTFLRKEYGQ